MYDYRELMKERIKVRSTNPERSAVLSMLLDAAYKVAKEENREPTESDIILAAKRAVKEIDSVEATVSSKVTDGSGDAMIAKYRAEKAIYQEFLPKLLSAEVIETLVAEQVSLLPEAERNKKSFGKVMAVLKSVPDMDSAILADRLKKALP